MAKSALPRLMSESAFLRHVDKGMRGWNRDKKSMLLRPVVKVHGKGHLTKSHMTPLTVFTVKNCSIKCNNVSLLAFCQTRARASCEAITKCQRSGMKPLP